jgi:hypothetical protein
MLYAFLMVNGEHMLARVTGLIHVYHVTQSQPHALLDKESGLVGVEVILIVNVYRVLNVKIISITEAVYQIVIV